VAAEPFEVSITAAEIADRRERLRRTRWPEPEPGLRAGILPQLGRGLRRGPPWRGDFNFSLGVKFG
jgi:hypothetical protein